jgi:hypothetical protein
MGIETAILIAGAATSAVSAISQGQQAKATGNYQAEQMRADADATRAEAQLEAAKIRKAGQRQRSSAIAAQAASGVKVDTGTAELINTEIIQNAEEDALTTIQSGGTRSRQMNAGAQAAQIGGKNAQRAGYMNAASTALGAGATVAKGWRTNTQKEG